MSIAREIDVMKWYCPGMRHETTEQDLIIISILRYLLTENWKMYNLSRQIEIIGSQNNEKYCLFLHRSGFRFTLIVDWTPLSQQNFRNSPLHTINEWAKLVKCKRVPILFSAHQLGNTVYHLRKHVLRECPKHSQLDWDVACKATSVHEVDFLLKPFRHNFCVINWSVVLHKNCLCQRADRDLLQQWQKMLLQDSFVRSGV